MRKKNCVWKGRAAACCCILGLACLPAAAFAQEGAGAADAGAEAQSEALLVSGEQGAMRAAELPLDEAGAQETALADAGVEEADAWNLRTKPDRENGEDVVEVEFSAGDNSYEYVIRESDGMILEWSIEGKDAGNALAELTLEAGAPAQDGTGQETEGTAADGTVLIGIGAAKEIVLQDLGADAEDAVFRKLKFEYDGRFYEYEMELYLGRAEYEYTVDAQSGQILEFEED